MTPDEYNFSTTWRILTEALPDGEVEEAHGLLLVATHVPFFYFNAAFVVDPSADPAAALAHAADWFDARSLPYSVRFSEHAPAFADAAADAGLTEGERAPLMSMPIAAVADDGPDLVVRAAQDEATLEDHVKVVAESFGAPVDWMRKAFGPGLLDRSDAVFLVGYLDGEPVASSAAVVTGEVGGVYNVGTPDAFRRRGYGERMTWAAVAESARRGCTTTTLQASAMGKPIYERMGYRLALHYRQFIDTRR